MKVPEVSTYDAIILAVGHDEFKKMSISDVRAYDKDNHILYDIKYIFDADSVDSRL